MKDLRLFREERVNVRTRTEEDFFCLFTGAFGDMEEVTWVKSILNSSCE